MGRLLFSKWSDQIIDNRKKPTEDQTAPEDFVIPMTFDAKEKVTAFMGWNGFAIFDESINIVDLSRAYLEAVQHYSCGRCYPCRIGTRIMLDILNRIEDGKGEKEDLQRLSRMGRTIQQSSKCQVGQTGTIPILDCIEYFKEDFLQTINNREKIPKGAYKSHLTAPCMDACPVHLDIPSYIEFLKDRKLNEAVELLRDRNALPGVCGKVCVRPCEFHCRRLNLDESIHIKFLKRYIVEYEMKHNQKPEVERESTQNEKIAIIGAGPAGLAAAFYLGCKGYSATIFEALPEGGGMAAVGIPDYRLPRKDLNYEIDVIKSLGIEIIYDTRVGKDITLQEIKEKGYKAIFIGIGAHNSKKMRVEGEDAGYEGFIRGVTFLLNINLGKEVPKGEKIFVVGGGNVAIDCVRSALRIGFKDVNLVYRRSRAEMPADDVEIKDAEEEGITFHFLTLPIKLLVEQGKIKGVECIRMELGEPDASGRRRPIPIEGSEFVIEADVVIPAIGQDPELSLLESMDMDVSKWGTLVVNEGTLMTSIDGIFSGGDCVTGAATLVEALAAGRDAAITIDRYLQGQDPQLTDSRKFEKFLQKIKVYDEKEDIEKLGGQPRSPMDCLPVETRIHSFDEVELGLTSKAALRDAQRCLRCYRVALLATTS
jgi:formate dehydrogenase beta subunit